MSDSPTPKPKSREKATRKRPGKWARRFVVVVVILIMLAPAALFGARVYFRATGQRDLGAEMARLDAEDPNWRFDDFMSAREKAAPPEAENSAVIVRKVRSAIPN